MPRLHLRDKIKILARLVLLAVLYFIIFSVVSAALLSPPSEEPGSANASGAIKALLVVSILNTAVLAYIVLRSRWSGWKLFLATFVVFFGVVTFMTQIETAFFVTRLPPGMLPRLFVAGAIVAAAFSLLLVFILGKAKHERSAQENHLRLTMPAGEWAVKLSLIVISYIVIYFTFGYFIAWQSAAVREYYGGTNPGSFFAQMATVISNTPWLVPLQALRALLWAGLAILVIHMMKARWWEAGLAVALLFSVVMNSQLLLPNPFMPEQVRMAHLVETASSNFLFGWIIVFLLGWRRFTNDS